VRILHLADVHLDRPFVGMDRDAARRRRAELREALGRCLAAAREQGADLVTIAGDLWEDEHVTPDTRAFVAHELGKLAPVPVLIACGNHDPLLAGGHWRRTAWPPNVRIFECGDPQEAAFGPVSVWGASWSATGLDTGFLRRPRDLPAGRRHLLLVHGTLRGVPAYLIGEGADAYAPFDPGDVERGGFHLCLAGHVHGAFREGPVVYPGSPEPLGWAERGRHCYALVDVEAGDASVSLVDVNRRRYVERDLDVTGIPSSAELAERIAAALDDLDAETLAVRLVLRGTVDRDCVVDAQALAQPHRERYAALVVRDLSSPGHDLAALSRELTAAGHFVRDLQDRIAGAAAGDERETLELALEAGLQALHGRKDVLRVD
jgi:DNA repair exonuclease SbcCD nuclease subunit